MNTLYYGDNLKILREYMPTESVDLIYLDPPFNSNRSYNVLFKDETGAEADSQIRVFDDTWHWNTNVEAVYHELITDGSRTGRMIESFRTFIGTNPMMAYLVMMAIRLKELHRVLKETGSLYLHCDPTASHYLKILLDTVFGANNFLNEITWIRTSSHNRAKRWGPVHDIILLYSKTPIFTWNRILQSLDDQYIKRFYRFEDDRGKYRVSDLTGPGTRTGDSGEPWRDADPNISGRHWEPPPDRALPDWFVFPEGYSKLSVRQRLDILDNQGLIHRPKKAGGMPGFKRYYGQHSGAPLQDVITDIQPIPSQAQERLHYPTQKPVALLERIISASSNEGDVVLDPFCGCGTTITAAQKLNRRWIGIDITHLAIALQKYRLKDSFGLEPLTGTKATTKSSPPYEGGVAAASADGVVLSESGKNLENHPTAKAVPLLRKEGSQSYQIIGEPEDLEGARQLASEDRYQFQWWALSMIKARPLGAATGSREGKKGADKGVDGVIAFVDDNSGKAKRVVISVKSGHVNVSHIRDLGHVIDRDDAAIGVYLTLEEPTVPMLKEAAGKGFYHSPGWNKDYPRMQILTVAELFEGSTVDLPPNLQTFKQAEKIVSGQTDQQDLVF